METANPNVKTMKLYKSINTFLWTIIAGSMTVIALYWLSVIVQNFKVINNLKNNISELSPFCPPGVYEILSIFNHVIPLIVIAHILIAVNSYYHQNLRQNYIKTLLSFTVFLLVFLGLLSNLSAIGAELDGKPFFSTIWWWPFNT